MSNINMISPDGGTTTYDIEDTPVRSSIARTEDGTSPSATINEDEEFYHLNVLYKATEDIATTDTITPNSNCEVSSSVTSQIAQKADKSALGTASTKNSTSVVTDSTDLVESGAVKDIVGWGNSNKLPPIIWHLNNNSSFDGDIADTNQIRARTTPAFAFPFPSQTFEISGLPSSITALNMVKCFDSAKTEIGMAQVSGYKFTTLANTAYIYILLNGENITVADMANAQIMVCHEGETPTTYEPYHASVEESLEDKVSYAEFTEVNSDIADIKAYIGYDDQSILGVQVDFEAKTFKRLGAAVGLTAGDDFDDWSMYGGRKRCTVADDGTINHYYGETGYAEDGSDGQVMVYQPKFYYKRQILKKTAQTDNGKGYNIRKANWFISDTPASGFKVHPAFLDENGREVDYILIGAYEGSLYDVSASAYITDDSQIMDNTADKFCSIANVKPASGLTQDLTRPKIEQMCQNRGSRWHEQNMQTYAATELLYLIEYGSFDIQRGIGKGVADITDQSAYNCSADTGSTTSFGNKSGRASSTTFNIGGTTTTQTVDGKTSITYRGEENPCLNIWKFVMGMNIYGNGSMNGGEPYICTDYNYAESKNDDNYSSVGFRLPNNGNYVSAFGCAADESLFDWIFIPGECTGGSDALPVGDYYWNSANLNGYRIAVVGAGWNGGFRGGLFCWNCSSGVGDRGRYRAGRLVYIPQGQAA